MSDSAFRVAVVGLGTVGVGVVQILQARAQQLAHGCGRPIQIVAAASRTFRDDVRSLLPENCAIFESADAAAALPQVDAVVETIGGSEGAALSAVRMALSAGKHVVTANKALLAAHGDALASEAEARGVQIRWEAAVGGGVPMVKLLREAAGGDEVRRVVGILNGTCNYILSRMEAENLSFEAVLADAQRLGYAEADPSFDVDGGDAAHKIALLAATAFGTQVPRVAHEGIRQITPTDISALAHLNYKVRLLAVAERRPDGSFACGVAPYAVPHDSPLGRTLDVLNVLVYDCRYAGTLSVRGRGAGREATAAAVVSDLCDLARGVRQFTFGRAAASAPAANLQPLHADKGAYYLRLSVPDRPGVLAAIAAAAADNDISIRRLTQNGRSDAGPVDVVIVTHPATRTQITTMLQRTAALCMQAPQALRIF